VIASKHTSKYHVEVKMKRSNVFNSAVNNPNAIKGILQQRHLLGCFLSSLTMITSVYSLFVASSTILLISNCDPLLINSAFGKMETNSFAKSYVAYGVDKF
jgi:hypothetical protein